MSSCLRFSRIRGLIAGSYVRVVIISILVGISFAQVGFSLGLHLSQTVVLGVSSPNSRPVDMESTVRDFTNGISSLKVFGTVETFICTVKGKSLHADGGRWQWVGSCQYKPWSSHYYLKGFSPQVEIVSKTAVHVWVIWLFSGAVLATAILVVSNTILTKWAALKNDIVEANVVRTLSLQVAHDIRSPLMALSNIGKLFPFDNTDARILFNESLRRIEKIASDVLRQSGKGKINSPSYCTSESIIALLKNVEQELCALKRSSQDLLFETNLKGIYGKGSIDDLSLQRVLINLITNALDSGDVQTVRILTQVRNQSLHISIVDQGCGMTKKQVGLAKKGVSMSKSGGHGIGLSSAIAIAKSKGGELRISSKPEKGTVVDLYIPWNPIG